MEPQPKRHARTIDATVEQLIGGTAKYTLPQIAELAGCELQLAQRFWRSMGFPDPTADQLLFTDTDVEQLRQWVSLFSEGELSLRAATSMMRAQSHTINRLVLWQLETLVQDLVDRYQLDHTTARLLSLDHVKYYLDTIQDQVTYTWRRQLGALLGHMDQEVGQIGKVDLGKDSFPLLRTFGFADMVSYTSNSAKLGANALADLVESFEFICRDVITSNGGRVVKTIGDAVLWVADTLPLGLRITAELVGEIARSEKLLPVRASVVQGRIMTRSGDIFGPSVNLASRLVDIAPTGEVYTDADTAKAIASLGGRWQLSPADPVQLRGVGEVTPYLLHW
ncbi:MAG: adenylate/guanylate cyclase domain-containing protein [Actinomycetaceae bacterium]|nr:adenylate/guanylate cyclase domain-containing protein [Actinomycetaceae bacterium]